MIGINGKEALIYYGEEKYLKRVFFEEGTGNLILKSYNPAYSDVIIKNNDLFAIGDNGMTRYLLDENDITNVVLKSELSY